MSRAQGTAGGGQGRRGSTARSAPRNANEVRLSEHPRARHQIRLAKGWAGVAGLALAGYVSWRSGVSFFDTALRALLWGIAAYIVVWFCAVQVWRHLAVAEVRAAGKLLRERRSEAERLARERAAQAQAERAATAAGSPQG